MTLETEHVLHWLWLTERLSGADAKIARVIKHFGGADEVFASTRFYNMNLSDADIEKLCDKSLSKAKKIYDMTQYAGGEIITIDSEKYPKLLKNTNNPPNVLYIKGKLPQLDDVLTVGVVGTRDCSDYGRFVTERLCAGLARAGAVTVSGMAAGIDAAGAWATVKEGSVAIGVIGGGIDTEFPKENKELYAAVRENGCIISQFPTGTPTISRNFPIRNRVIAGLSHCVLVTDAPQKSGALITAKCAMEEGRRVFAVPRNISDVKHSGTNRLIQQGACLVMHPNDILREYPYAKSIEPVKPSENTEAKALEMPAPQEAEPSGKIENNKENKDKNKSRKNKEKKAREASDVRDILKKLSALTAKGREIAVMLLENDMEFDELTQKTDMSAAELSTELTMLEMMNVVEKLPGGKYRFMI